MVASAVAPSPITSWWYGQGRAVDTVRRLESLHHLDPPPGRVGVVTVQRDQLTATFVDELKDHLPHPWQPAGSRDAALPWEAVNTNADPDKAHPVYLVVFGVSTDGSLVGLNLGAFARLRIDGDRDIVRAVAVRWILELLSTHPDTTIGVTADVWATQSTSRVKLVNSTSVPRTDVLILGADLSYAERAQIVDRGSSPILLDLGRDAALSTPWTITCNADQTGEINGPGGRPMAVTLIVPSADVLDMCAELVVKPAPGKQRTPGWQPPVEVEEDRDYINQPFSVSFNEPGATVADVPDTAALATDGDLDTDIDSAEDVEPSAPLGWFEDKSDTAQESQGAIASPLDDGHGIAAPTPDNPDGAAQRDQFSTALPEEAGGVADLGAPSHSIDPLQFDDHPAYPEADDGEIEHPTAAELVGAQPVVPSAVGSAVPDQVDETGAAPQHLPVIWNRILGQVELVPPHGGAPKRDRENRNKELTVFLQAHARSADEIKEWVFGGAAKAETVTQTLSELRRRLGALHIGGPVAFPKLNRAAGDTNYRLAPEVLSDWMVFDKLVELIPERTPTVQLVAAMDLVTGAPLGGINAKDWAWSADLCEELRERVPGAAVALANRYHSQGKFALAVEVARKGLWYDPARQDLWQVALQAALDGHDKETVLTLRRQYLDEIPGAERDPAVEDLTRRG